MAALALAWNALGIVTFWLDTFADPAALAALPDTERALRAQVRTWATAAYGVAVFAGTLGSFGLLLRKAWATPLLALSLAAIAVQMGQALFMTELVAVRGPTGAVLPLVILAVAVLLLLLARLGRRRGWIG